jgi:beta-phosphoglucomutase
MNKKAIIFDLDGVIVDTAKYHFLACRKLAKSLGLDFTEEQNEQLKGVSRIESLKKILNWGDITLSKEEFETLLITKNNDYLAHVSTMDESEILPGVKNLLDYLVKQNYAIALGSASKNSRSILKKVNLLNSFDVIVDGNDVIYGKPNPEGFLKAAKKLSIAPENCIVFEDAVAGIQAANTANMLSIGIGKKSVLHEANYIFKDFTEFDLNFIKKIGKTIA